MKIVKASAAAKKATYLLTSADALKELALDKTINSAIKQALKEQPMVSVASLGLSTHAHIIVTRKAKWKSANALRRNFGKLGHAAQRAKAGDVLLHISAAADKQQAGIALQGFIQGAYRFDRYLSKKTDFVKKVLVASALTTKDVQAQVNLSTAIRNCRDLINTPAEDMGPEQFVSAAKRMFRGTAVRLRVMNEAACKKAKMGALLAVGRASPRRPRLLILEAGPKAKNFYALCGKGVCFDTGGLGIKTSKGMQLMRKDMGGAATVLCALRAAVDAGLKKSIRVYIPLVENNIDGNAFRPGDILTAADGTTIEVGHTDAEGRLILADALCQARKEGAAAVGTIATLTGAAMIALGRVHVPVMGDDDQHLKILAQAADACGEKIWRLPLDADHRKLMNTVHADISNSGNGEAGCITAGAFLQHFAGGLPFVHCDISPCSWQVRDHDLGPTGATGILVDSLSKFLLKA